MAIYHYHREIGKRRDGKNAVFAAAYIRGEKRTCYRTEETKDFNKRHDVVYKECLLPDDAPEWALKLRHSHIKGDDGHYQFDQSGFNFSDTAWNQIEIMEKRADSQLYFHDDFAIPIELDQDNAIALVRQFAKDVLATDGFFCDVAVHWDLINPHAHVVMPLRQFTDTGFSKTKIRFGKNELSQLVKTVRAKWADYANQKMMELGIDARIDHRSNRERGIKLIPTVKVGKAKYMHDTKLQEIRIAENQLIRAKNFANIQANPQLLTDKLQADYQTFSQDDVNHELSKYVTEAEVLKRVQQQEDASKEKLVNDIIDYLKQEQTIFSERELKNWIFERSDNSEIFEAISNAVCQSNDILPLGLGDDGREHFVTRAAFELECDLIKLTSELNRKQTFLVSDDLVISAAREFGLNDSQTIALKHLTLSGDLAIVTGYAGTGKTYMLKAAKQVWEQSGYRVHGIAFSGRASVGLENESGIKSTTIAGFLSQIEKGYKTLSDKDIVVMDEMGMATLDDLHAVQSLVNSSGSKLAGVGDTEQLQSVGRGAAMRTMISEAGHVVMDTIMRQQVEWQRDATLEMETFKTGVGLDAYNEHGFVSLVDDPLTAKNTVIEKWHDGVLSTSDHLKEHILIAFKNETVDELNQLARARLIMGGQLSSDGIQLKTSTGLLNITQGERLVFNKTDYRTPVKNGEFGTVINFDDQKMTVLLDSGREILLSRNDTHAVTYGYAATIHRLQGFTGNYSSLYVDSRVFDRQSFLVTASRHRLGLNIVADKDNFNDYAHLKETVSRYGLRDSLIDYPVSFAMRRGYEPKRVTKLAVNFIRHSKEKIHDAWLWLFNYQALIEKQQSLAPDPNEALKQRRKDAMVVADFCDKRIDIAKSVEALKAMPGYELRMLYSHVPIDEEILSKTLYLYHENDMLYFAARNDYDEVVRHKLELHSLEQSISTKIEAAVFDIEERARLSDDNKALLFDVTTPLGFSQINMDEKISRQRTIYQKQLDNSQRANIINDNMDYYQLALDRNRISRDAIKQSVDFGDRHDEIHAIASEFKLSQFYDPFHADKIMSNIKDYYGHIISALGNKKEKNQFILELRHQSHQHRYDLSLKQFEKSYLPSIETVKRYLDLDHEIAAALYQTEKLSDDERDAHKLKLHEYSIERNQLANTVLTRLTHFEPLIEHFDIDQNRLKHHQQHFNARETVKRFSELTPSLEQQNNLERILLAHRIKSRPKLYGIYLNDFLKDGFKSVNLENWRYEHLTIKRTASPELKVSIKQVQNYNNIAKQTGNAWKAYKKRCEKSSHQSDKYKLRAQVLSCQRDKVAYELIQNMEQHAGSVVFEKVDLKTLASRAYAYQMIERYRHENNELKQTRLAHIINNNFKRFGALVEINGLAALIKTQARYYDYLKLMKKASDSETRQLIRQISYYEQKRIDACIAWSAVKIAERLNRDATLLKKQAKLLGAQRNLAAFELIECCKKQNIGYPQITGIKCDTDKLKKYADQHVAYQSVKDYLQAPANLRGAQAAQLLANRASYHFIFDHNIDFKVLNREAKQWQQAQQLVKQTTYVETKRFDADLISRVLMADPQNSYLAILGEPSKRNSREWRYPGALIITMTGDKKGQWYSFSEEIGGGPIKAIQHYLGLSGKEALKYGTRLAGLSEHEAMITELKVNQPKQKTIDHSQVEATRKLNAITSARSIWDGAITPDNSIVTRYFREHRHVPELSNMEIRYWPAGAKWIDYDEQGNPIEKINKLPAAVIAGFDQQKEMTCVQRIYLDKKTANKASFMDNPKLSKGVIQGSAGLIQRGKIGGHLYLVEGPETGASIALAAPDATVLVSLGVNNLSKLSEVILSYSPSQVTIARDNDINAMLKGECKARIQLTVTTSKDNKAIVKHPQDKNKKHYPGYNLIIGNQNKASQLIRKCRGKDELHYDVNLIPGLKEFINIKNSEFDVNAIFDRINRYENSTQHTTDRALWMLREKLQPHGISVDAITPPLDAIRDKVDWNDILVNHGLEVLKNDLGLNNETNKISSYYEAGVSIAYTPAEHYLREVKGVIGVDLSDLRYHAKVPLPNEKKTAKAILVPITDLSGKRSGELQLFLDNNSEKVTQINYNGDNNPGLYIAQQGTSLDTLYVVDNIIDAKSIAVGDHEATIIVSHNGYRDSDTINNYINQLPKKPAAVAFVSDNITQTEQQRLYPLTENLRQSGHHVVIVKGKLSGDYTHVSINEALRGIDKIRGANYIHRVGFTIEPPKKLSLKEKLSKMVKGEQNTQQNNTITRPVIDKKGSYYIQFNEDELNTLKNYFSSISNLEKNDGYHDALKAAQSAQAVYEKLIDKYREAKFHPQHINQNQKYHLFEEIRERVLMKKPLGLHDVNELFRSIAEPKLDSKTKTQFMSIAEQLKHGGDRKALTPLIENFMKEKSALVNAWRSQTLMPEGQTTLMSHVNLEGQIDRGTFITICKSMIEWQQHHSTLTKQSLSKSLSDDDEHSRGGRSL